MSSSEGRLVRAVLNQTGTKDSRPEPFKDEASDKGVANDCSTGICLHAAYGIAKIIEPRARRLAAREDGECTNF
jgi:hypothetical protein